MISKFTDDLSSLRGRWKAPSELESLPKPRQTRLSKLGKMNVYAGVFGLLAILGAFGFIFNRSLNRYKDFQAIQREGVQTTASITGKRRVRGRGAHYNVSYGYQVQSQNYQTETRVSYSYYQAMQPGAPIAILYLPSRPQVSRIVGEVDRKPSPLMVFLPVLSLLVFIPTITRTQKQNNLLRNGDAAPGIVDKATRMRNGYAVRYRFLNEMDQVITGKTLVTGSVPIEGDIITVLYFPGQSSQNTLYPAPFAVL